jgi:hypothetical protein
MGEKIRVIRKLSNHAVFLKTTLSGLGVGTCDEVGALQLSFAKVAEFIYTSFTTSIIVLLLIMYFLLFILRRSQYPILYSVEKWDDWRIVIKKGFGKNVETLSKPSPRLIGGTEGNRENFQSASEVR